MNKVYANHTMFTDHRVIFAIVDQMKIRKRHEKLYKKMYDLTWFYTSRLAYTLDCSVVYYDSVDEALENCQEYDTVIMQSVGNLIQENEFLELVDQYVRDNPDFFYVGFTLDWQGDEWVELHHQMIIFNEQRWIELGKPTYGDWQTATEELPNYSRSEENFHDHYTPYWIKGEPGTTVGQRTKQGWGMIKAALENGIKIDNFSQAMRDCRLFLYPESDSYKFFECIVNRDITDPSINSNQKRWIKTFKLPPQIWIFNSEAYYFPQSVTKKIDTYMGPAAGFKYLDVLRYNDTVKFVLYDYNERSVEWIKMLHSEWDGKNLGEYLKTKTDYIPYYKYINGTIEANIKILFNEFGGEEEFLKLWTRFKSSEVEFVVTNLYDELELKSLSGRCSGTTLFYYSNIFATDLMIKIMSLEETRSAHDRAVAVFKERGDVILYGTNFLSEWKIIRYNKETENA
jgi:hypothetical protein